MQSAGRRSLLVASFQRCKNIDLDGPALFHIALHLLVPAILVALLYRDNWKFAYLVLIATMLVDLDHLLAVPIYDPNRCSIGFHPLHQPLMIMPYAGLSVFPKTRLIGFGLLIHMALDAVDCLN